MPFTIDDRAAIHDLNARYAHAFDSADADAWAALFTPDGRMAPPGADPIVGTDALRAFVTDRTRATPGMRHVIANVLVEPHGDGAKGRSYFLCFRLGGDGRLRMRNFGRYDDTFARHDGGWRIANREIVSELPVELVDAPFAFDGA